MTDDEIKKLAREIINKMGGDAGKRASRAFDYKNNEGRSPRDPNKRFFDKLEKTIDEFGKKTFIAKNKFAKDLEEELNSVGNTLAKTLAKTAKKFKDMELIEDRTIALKNIVDELNKLKNEQKTGLEDFNKSLIKIYKAASNADMSLKDLGIAVETVKDKDGKLIKRISNLDSVLENLTEAEQALSKSANVAAANFDELSERVEQSKRVLRKTSDLFREVMNGSIETFLEETKYRKQFAVADAGYIEGIKELAVTQLQYAEALKETRAQQLSANGMLTDSTKVLKDFAKGLQDYSATPQEALEASVMLTKAMSNIGINQALIADSTKGLLESFKKYGRVYSMGSKEFAELVNTLATDNSITQDLLYLREKDRKLYFDTLVKRQMENKLLGFTTEQLLKMQQTLAEINKLSPKERMKRAAKARVMFASMGMAGEGAEFQQLMIRRKYTGAAERADIDKRLTELAGELGNRFYSMTGQGANMGQAFTLENLMDKTGMMDFVETFNTEQAKGRKVTVDISKQTNEINDKLKDLVFYTEGIKNLLDTSVGKLGQGVGGKLFETIGSAILEGLIVGKMAKFGMPKGIGKGGGLLSRIGGGLLCGIKGIGGVVANAGKGALGGMGGLLGGMLSKGKGMVGKIGMEGLGKMGLKSLVKKIPAVGAIAGLGFAGYRLFQGDFAGAGLEALSGLASLLPGLGTAASIAIDAGLAARDAAKEAKDKVEETSNTGELSETKKQTKSELLTETLISINKFLNENMELTKQQNNILLAMSEEMHLNLRTNTIKDYRELTMI